MLIKFRENRLEVCVVKIILYNKRRISSRASLALAPGGDQCLLVMSKLVHQPPTQLCGLSAVISGVPDLLLSQVSIII